MRFFQGLSAGHDGGVVRRQRHPLILIGLQEGSKIIMLIEFLHIEILLAADVLSIKAPIYILFCGVLFPPWSTWHTFLRPPRGTARGRRAAGREGLPDRLPRGWRVSDAICALPGHRGIPVGAARPGLR